VTDTLIRPAALRDILTGILSCLAIISVMYGIPLVGIFAWVLLPLPILFYRLKTGRKYSGVIMAATIAILGIVTGQPAFNSLYFGFMMVTGFFLGEFIEQHLSIEKIMIYSGIAVFAVCILAVMIYAMASGHGPVNFITSYAARYQAVSAKIFSDSASMYSDMPIDRQALEKAGALFVFVLPAIFINSYMTMAWLNILFIRKILAKKAIIVKSLENLSHWRAPWFLVWGVIGASALMFLPSAAIRIPGINCLIILMFIYFFQGIAVVSFFFQKKNAPFALRILIYVLIAIQPLFMFCVIGCGLFDNWFNFRKLDTTL